jgi:2-polyprenyl-3-methyl-5-hydroxy-6-metoxy-1,4-benzoquinol methylase
MDSYTAHNSQYCSDEALNKEIDIHKKKTYESKNKLGSAWDNLYKKGHLHGEWLDKNEDIKDLVDIGCGTGWFVNYIADNKNFENIIGIEPSQSAIEISKTIYEYNNKKIKYYCSFAEDTLPEIKLENPTLFTTFIVLSHLDDVSVKKILNAMDKIAPKGSVFIFNENYGNTFTINLWHSRTQKWWEESLPNWSISYDERPRPDLQHYNQGLMGVKN